jgi:hypothetical protein
VGLETGLDVVDHGQVAEQADVLERSRDPEPRDPVGGRPGDVTTIEPDRARRRLQEPGEHMEERRLARAVGSDHAVDRARRKPQIVVGQRLQSAKRLRQPPNLEEGVAAYDGGGDRTACHTRILTSRVCHRRILVNRGGT